MLRVAIIKERHNLVRQERGRWRELWAFHEASSGALTLSAADVVSFSYGCAARVSQESTDTKMSTM